MIGTFRPARRLARVVLILALAVLAVPARIPAQVVESGAPFLLLPIGARLVALGGAGVADPTGQDALLSNPAAFARPRRRELAIDFGKDEVTPTGRYVASATLPVRVIGTFAAGLYVAPQPAFPSLDSNGVEIGSVLVRDVALTASYGSKLSKYLLAGVTYRFIQKRYDCSGACDTTFAARLRASTTALDLGVQVDSLRGVPFRFGLAVRNLGLSVQFKDDEQSDALPTVVAAGVAYDVPRFERTLPNATLTGFAEVTRGLGRAELPSTVHLGAELRYQRTFVLRGGYSDRGTDFSGPTIGLGFVRSRLTVDVARQLGSSGLLGSDPPTYVSLRYAF